MKRYEWEDSLIEAQADGIISNGSLLVALKLAKAINWSPKGKTPGLYWANEEALKAVGCGRSTYFKHRAALVGTGKWFIEINGNLIPTMPKSTVETEKSIVETTKSTVWTGKSTGDNPFTVDILSEDIFSVNIFNK